MDVNKLWGRRVLWIGIGVFALVLCVNAVMIYYASTSFSGVVTENAYEKGLAYNQVLHKNRDEQALGWKAEVLLGAGDTLVFKLTDAAGNALKDARVHGQAMRVVGDEQAFSFEASASGDVYVAAVRWPLRGQWQVVADVVQGGQTFSVAARVVVP